MFSRELGTIHSDVQVQLLLLATFMQEDVTYGDDNDDDEDDDDDDYDKDNDKDNDKNDDKDDEIDLSAVSIYISIISFYHKLIYLSTYLSYTIAG